MRGKVLLLSVSLLASLILAEVIVRFTLGPPALFLYTGSFHDRQTDWDVVYGVDEQRHRTPCITWNGTTLRIAVIGDSFVFGQGVSDCNDFSAVLNRVQRKLYYVNLGGIGFGINEYLQIADDLIDHDYQEIILLFYGNDWLQNPPSMMQWMVSHSALLSLLRRVRRQRITSGAIKAAVNSREPWNNIRATLARDPDYTYRMVEPDDRQQQLFAKYFNNIIAILSAHVGRKHIHVAMAPVAHTVSPDVRHFVKVNGGHVAAFGLEGTAYRELRVLSDKQGVDFIETYSRFLKNGGGLYHPHDFHWNIAGHQQMAFIIQHAVEARKVLMESGNSARATGMPEITTIDSRKGLGEVSY